MLPNLGRLALGAHDEEPTGVLDSAIGKSSKKRITIAEWKRRKEARPLEGLPLELRQLVTEQLVAKNANDWPSVCQELEAWCKAHPVACTKQGLWRAAFEAAFGPLDPHHVNQHVFKTAYRTAQFSDPLPYKAMFKETCELLSQFGYFFGDFTRHLANWTPAQLDWFWKRAGSPERFPPNAAPLKAFLRLRGADLDRYHQQLLLINSALSSDRGVDAVRALLDDGCDPDYVLPSDRGSLSAESLLYKVCVRAPDFEDETLQIAQLLLEYGANPNGIDARGKQLSHTTLHAVVSRASDMPGAPAMFELLLAHGADPTVRGYRTLRERLVALENWDERDDFLADKEQMLQALDAAIAAWAAAAT